MTAPIRKCVATRALKMSALAALVIAAISSTGSPARAFTTLQECLEHASEQVCEAAFHVDHNTAHKAFLQQLDKLEANAFKQIEKIPKCFEWAKKPSSSQPGKVLECTKAIAEDCKRIKQILDDSPKNGLLQTEKWHCGGWCDKPAGTKAKCADRATVTSR